MLEKITPVIITYNEIANIKKTLDKLSWATTIIVVDSGSNDGTVEFLQEQDNVQIFYRKFTNHAEQWNFAIRETGITDEWVLCLDADYILSDELISEIDQISPETNVSGYITNFLYCINGKVLRCSIYPPVTILFRRRQATYVQDGHTQRVNIDGDILKLNNIIYHDDRKTFSFWLNAQKKYMRIESINLYETNWKKLKLADQIRRLRIIAPFIVFFYILFLRAGILDGKAGLIYATQRFIAEGILSIYLIKMDIKYFSRMFSGNTN